MDALISGRAGAALLWEHGLPWFLRLSEPRKVLPANKSLIRLVFGGAIDLTFLENTSVDSVVRTLELQQWQNSALDLLLICVDPELSVRTRSDATLTLNHFLAEPEIVKKLETILYAKPLPVTADLAKALDFAYSSNALKVRELLHKLSESQQGITEARLAWDSIPVEVFGGEGERLEFTGVAIREGLFHRLAVARGSGSKVDEFRVSFLSNVSVTSLNNYREVLHQWVAPFLNHRKAIDLFDIEAEDLDGQLNRGRKPTRRSFNRAAQFERTNRQKENIVRAMRRRDYVRVRNLIDELIANHMAWDGPKFAVKSLCDLAMEAKLFGRYSLQLELTEHAIKLQPEDGWSWRQYADALLRNERLSEALLAYERASELEVEIIAHTGRAEVLKKLWRFDDALRSYDVALKHFPNSVSALSGRAEVLKEMRKLDEALESYDAIVSKFPEEMRVRSARAEVLAELGRLKEALESYDAIIVEYPDDIVPRSGRAQVLRSLGNLDEALESYDELIAADPRDTYLRNSRAEVLKDLGRLDDALSEYNACVDEFPEDRVAKHGRADTLKAMHLLDDALKAYDAIVAEFPEDVRARNARAGVLKELGRLEEALDSYDAIIFEYPENLFARTGRAHVLRLLRRFDEALMSFDALLQAHPDDRILKNGRSSVLLSMRRYQEALETLGDDESDLITRGDWISHHLRGMIHLQMGRIGDAAEIFERGLRENPWNLEREYFRTAAAVVKLRMRDFEGAQQALEQITTPELQPHANVFRVHCFGELHKDALAAEAFDKLTNHPSFISDELIDALHRTYIVRQSPLKQSEWFAEQEVQLLPLLITQQYAATI